VRKALLLASRVCLLPLLISLQSGSISFYLVLEKFPEARVLVAMALDICRLKVFFFFFFHLSLASLCFESGSCSIVQVSLQLLILLPQPPEQLDIQNRNKTAGVAATVSTLLNAVVRVQSLSSQIRVRYLPCY
jgi:hypothetical protein